MVRTKYGMIGALLCVTGTAGPRLKAAESVFDAARFESVGLTKHWDAQLPLSAGEVVKQTFLVDDALYVATTGGTLFALQADVGLLRWGLKITEPGYTIFRPAHVRSVDGIEPVLLTATDACHLLDRYSGDSIQRFNLQFPPAGGAVGVGNVLFVGGNDANVYSLRRPVLSACTPNVLWTVKLPGVITATPILYDDADLLLASRDGGVYSCRGRDKQLNWWYRTSGPILGDPWLDESGVYVSSTDRSLYRLHRTTGSLLWRVRLPVPLHVGPIVSAHVVFQYCPGRGVVAIDADTGAEKWWVEGGLSFVAHHRERDIFFTGRGELQAVDRESGVVHGVVDAAPAAFAVANAQEAGVFLVSESGMVVCFRMDSVPYLRLQQILAAKRQLSHPAAVDFETTAVPKSEVDSSDADPFRSPRDLRP